MSANVFPINIDQNFLNKVQNFPEEVYSFNETNNLYALMNTLLGDSGAGQLTKLQTTAFNTQDLRGIEFTDLDQTIGFLTGIARKPSENYSSNINPFGQQLNRQTWDSVYSDDSEYRERLSLLLTAINNGATVLGLTLIAEAALGVPVRIIEKWKSSFSGGSYIYLRPGSTPVQNNNIKTLFSSVFQTNSPNEFAIVPIGGDTISQDSINALMQMIELLKPANSFVTFYNPNYTYKNISYSETGYTVTLNNGNSARPQDVGASIYGPGIPSGITIAKVGSLTNGTPSTLILSKSVGVAITAVGVTGSSGAYTFTYAASNTFIAGQQVTVAGFTSTAVGFNGTFTVLAANSGSFAVSSAATTNVTPPSSGSYTNCIATIVFSQFSITSGSSVNPYTPTQIVSDSNWFEFDMFAISNIPIQYNNNVINQYPDRFWLNQNSSQLAPVFAHGQTIEEEISLNNLISSITLVSYSSNSIQNNGGNTIELNSVVTNASVNISSTIYGAQ